jgi:hypothetical protein
MGTFPTFGLQNVLLHFLDVVFTEEGAEGGRLGCGFCNSDVLFWICGWGEIRVVHVGLEIKK